MKKILCSLIVCIILCMSVAPCCVFAAGEETPPTIVFNEKIDYVPNSNITLTPGTTYRITGYINVTANVTSLTDGKLSLQWYQNGHGVVGDPDYVRFKDAKTLVPYIKNEWQFFEIDYVYPAAVEITTTTWIQIYNGITRGFTIKDYSISKVATGNASVPVAQDERSMRLVKGGTFEDNFVATDWTMSDTETAPTYFGADGTMTALELDMKANGKFGQNVATQSGEYTGTLYTKGDTAGVSILANEAPVVATTEAVADGWTKHTFDYTATGATEFSVTSDADTVFSIDEFSIEPKAASAALYADNIKLSGKLLAGETISFNWGYSKDYSGKAMVKVYEYVSGAWTVRDYDITAAGATSYSLSALTEADEGKKFKIEILPIDAPQGTVVNGSYYETPAVKKTFDVNTDNFVETATDVSAIVEVTNFVEGKDILVTICLFDAKNALIDFDSVCIPSAENSVLADAVSCVKTSNSVYARVFVWGGTGIDSSDMSSIKEVSEWELN